MGPEFFFRRGKRKLMGGETYLILISRRSLGFVAHRRLDGVGELGGRYG